MLLVFWFWSSLEDNEIPGSQLQFLESNGPSINKSVYQKGDKQIAALSERKRKSLVNTSTCNLHVCHNAFQKGLSSKLVISFHIWFKLSGSRREEYEEVERSCLLAHKFLEHIE